MLADDDIFRDLHSRTSLGWAGPGVRIARKPPQPPATDAPSWRPRSTRVFTRSDLAIEELGSVLSAAFRNYGDGRTYPSAGALYGIGLLACRLGGSPVWQLCRDGRFDRLAYRDVAEPGLRPATFHQITGNPWIIVMVGHFPDYAARYGARGYRYILLESGHLMQELLRATASAGIATCPLGAFDDSEVTRLVGLSPDHLPLYLLVAECMQQDG